MRTTLIATLACTAAASSFLNENDEKTFRFWRWALDEGRNYQTTEELYHRFEQWMITDAEIEKLNNSNLTSTHDHHKFSDWTQEEFKKMLGDLPDDEDENVVYTYLDSVPDNSSVNWKSQGKVTSVKDQGHCGSCWAFSSTAALESAHAIASGSLINLSEQQLVDCDDTSHGCNGGSHLRGQQYALDHKMMLLSDYPYKAVQGSCKYNSSKGKVKASSVHKVPTESPSQLKAAIAQSPTAVSVEADKYAFSSYKSGVLCSGCGTEHNHGVLAVGYGSLNGTPYYLIKNSWGSSWGDNGYLRIGITSGIGCCGIQSKMDWSITN